MKVKSKNTGDLHDITRKQWDIMRKRGDNRHYQIIDDTDEITQAKIEIEEISVTEFGKEKNDAETDYDKLDEIGTEILEKQKEYYREALREADIYFHPNTGLKKLKQKYEEI